MPSIARKRTSQPVQRSVACTHCDQVTEVSQRAMSVFCPHCKKRLVLEDYTITTYHGVRSLATCGDVVIEKRGHMSAAVKAETMTIKGKMQGSVVARREVVIHRTANCQSDIESPRLIIENGAVLNGFVRIGVDELVSAGQATLEIESGGTVEADDSLLQGDAVHSEAPIKPRRTVKKVVRKKVVRKKRVTSASGESDEAASPAPKNGASKSGDSKTAAPKKTTTAKRTLTKKTTRAAAKGGSVRKAES